MSNAFRGHSGRPLHEKSFWETCALLSFLRRPRTVCWTKEGPGCGLRKSQAFQKNASMENFCRTTSYLGRNARAAEDSGPNFDRCVAISRSALRRQLRRGTELEVGTSIRVRAQESRRARTGGFETGKSLRGTEPRRDSREKERARGIRRMQMHFRHSSSFHGLFTKRRVTRCSSCAARVVLTLEECCLR